MSLLQRGRALLSCAALAAALGACGPSQLAQTPEASWYAEQILTAEERQDEATVKLARLTDFLRRESLSGVLITTVRNFAWITAGGDSHIRITSENGAVPIFIRDDGRKYYVTSHSEAPRMRDEDLKGMGYEWKEIPWYGDKVEPNQLAAAVQELSGGRPFGSDIPFPGARVVDAALAGFRVPLTEQEIRKYRWLGRRCAEAVDRVCRALRPGMTERGIEALISDALLRHAIRPTVLLVAADDRVLQYRHAPPSDFKKVEKYAMVNVCARRWGLVIAMTRFVHFGPLPEDLQRKMTATARVNAGLWARTVPGATADSIFRGAVEDYAAAGYPDEWRRHHQGGAIGYQERDWFAVPGSGRTVVENAAFAWNPSIEGTKVEDTVLLVGERFEVLTEIRGWPVIESRALGRTYRSPAILVR